MAVTLDGTFNFRDTGGIPLRGGGSIAPGVLYRSDALGGLTESGRAALAASDIRVIVDLRTDEERRQLPNRLPAEVVFETLEPGILDGRMLGGTAADVPDPRADPAALAALLERLPSLSQLYERMLERSAASFATLARSIAATADPAAGTGRVAAAEVSGALSGRGAAGARSPSGGGVPGGCRTLGVLVHCTAGKDRTGVGVALMLDAVGAQRAAIVADYARSESQLAGPWSDTMLARLQQFGITPNEAIATLVTASPPAAIEHALRWLDDRGGAEAYLRDAGVTADEFAHMRDRLTHGA